MVMVTPYSSETNLISILEYMGGCIYAYDVPIPEMARRMMEFGLDDVPADEV